MPGSPNEALTIKPVKPTNLSTLIDDTPIDFTRLLHMLFDDLETQIARADQKAQIILSADALLIAAFANFGFGQSVELIGQTIAHADSIPLGIIVLQLLALILLLVSIFYALRVALPQFKRSTGPQPQSPSLFYSGYIDALDTAEYVDKFLRITQQDVKRMVLEGIHAKSRVARAKFVDVRRSMITVMVAIGVWAVSEIIINLL